MAIEVNWKRLWLPFLAIMVTVGVLWFTNRAVTPKESTWDDVVAEAGEGGYRLINTDELKQKYETDSRNILLVDTRQDWEFAMGHIKGAVNFPMEPTAWSRWQKKGKLAEALGPDKNRLIIFY
ncbi:putative sulfurtransferase [Desulfomonile tiedjei DSM 6799]|uniref:Putative sulfurtransferase n=2 Tax=Desulfomonile tiedjei TaxID=2358 RepID=I4C5D7_DESTA|nr:rhodanese-like domain-containing protein [Desulfomonile tiedjei]AFM24778.1 putative sulfurtransferase [Desulfomonile tiedjei DSM 6799]